MSVIRNQYNSRELLTKGEINNLPSLTVPNMTLSLKTLLTKYVRGEPIPATLNPLPYTGADEIIDVTGMNEMDMIDAAREQAKHVTKIQLEIDDKNRVRVQEEEDKKRSKKEEEPKDKHE